MQEVELRKMHRFLGVFLSLLIIVQAGSGLLLTFTEKENSDTASLDSEFYKELKEEGEEKESPLEAAMEAIHAEGGIIGIMYRLILGSGLMFMALSGSLIFMKIKGRQKKKGAF